LQRKSLTGLSKNMETGRSRLSWNITKLNSQFRIAILAFLVATVCFLSAKLAGALIINIPQTVWPLWPGCAVLVAILLLLPRKIWPVLLPAGLAGFVLYDLQAGVSISSIAWLILADSLEILVAAWGVSYSLNGLPRLNSLKALAKYSFFTVFLASLLVSSIGIQGLSGNGWLSWRFSFLSEALAFLTVTPAILGLLGQGLPSLQVSRAHYLEAAIFVCVLVCLSYLMFAAPGRSAPPALLYSLVPFLIWSALRFGSAGVGASATIVALMSIWGAVHGRGPFTETDPINRVLTLQVFLLFTSIPFMVLAVLVEERKRVEGELREGEERFRLVANTAPVLIWMAGTDKLCNFFNQGWLNFTGRSMEQELGEGWVSGVHPEDVQRCLGIYSASFDARAQFEMEYRLRRFDGEYRWIVDYGTPRVETDGTFRGYIGSCVDITERKSSEEFLHSLSGRLIHAQEQERARIARELHDDFSQRLALLGIGLGQLVKEIPDSQVKQRTGVLEMVKGINEMSSDFHSLSHQLHSSKLELVGLVPALNGLCKEIGEKYKIEIHFAKSGFPRKIKEDVELCLFRVTQEALGNVVKHSQSKSVQVELDAKAIGVSLRIVDAGRGFEPDLDNPAAGIGLVGMRERLRLVGGSLSVKSELLGGTEILAEIPLAVSASEAQVRTQAAKQ
jgi:PAS domain S-box-containing protein